MVSHKPKVAIVDYCLGNLFSVKHACEHVGLAGSITSNKREVLAADAVILPGVGAFGDAMENLRRLDLVQPLKDIAQSGTPLIGICLGQQLLMTESFEFGRHKGLGILEGEVVRFEKPQGPEGILKVPQVGWNRIHPPQRGGQDSEGVDAWKGTPLEGIRDGEYMYFVHSFYIKPANSAVAMSLTQYGHIEFTSSVRHQNVVAFQYHPERSGIQGMRIYQNLAAGIRNNMLVKETANAA